MPISRKLSLLVFLVLATLMVVVAPACAKVIHEKEASFKGSGAPSSPFGPILPSVAVDNTRHGPSAGDVYVAESNAFGVGNSLVDKFEANGKYAGVQITGATTPAASFAFGLHSGIAVDSSTGPNKGDLYVADTRHGVVDRFSESGAFQCQITGKKPVSAEEIAHECNGAAGSLVPGGGSITPGGVAVSSANGDLYVADDAHGVIDEFGSSGEYLTQITSSHLVSGGEMGPLALDSLGDLYVNVENSGEGGKVIEFDPAGHFVRQFSGGFAESLSVAVNPATNEVYVFENGQQLGQRIAEYEEGVLISVIPLSESLSFGLAVDAASGKLYATELSLATFEGSVSIFGPDVATPSATPLPPTSVSETSATLNGHLDPGAAHNGGLISACRFEWGATSAYGHTLPCQPGPYYAHPEDVSASITGLTRSSEYHFRVVAKNEHGETDSEDLVFAAAGPPVIDSEYSFVSGVDAALKARIDSFGFATTCQVQYVDEAGFQSSGYAKAVAVPCTRNLGSSFTEQLADVQLGGLKVDTTYHYRFIATSQVSTTTGADRTLHTFGIQSTSLGVISEAGEGHPYTQAGGHPYELRFGVEPTWTENVGGIRLQNRLTRQEELPTGNPRTVITKVPAGLIGDPQATPKCTPRDLFDEHCSGAAQVGSVSLVVTGEPEGFGSGKSGGFGKKEALYNLVPPRGVVAEFGFNILEHVSIYIRAGLRSGEDYGVIAESPDNTIVAGVQEILIHFWGVPADPSHDNERECALPGPLGGESPCTLNERVLKPFLRNPTSCVGALSAGVALDSWQAPGQFAERTVVMPAITGCENVPFSPSLAVAPTTNAADSASGLSFDLHLPQPDEVNGLAESDLKDTTVTFPAGVTVDPSSADGLAACSEAQVGFTGFKELNPGSEPGVKTPQFTPLPAQCPDASKLGTVEADSRLVDHPLTGSIYLARQGENPFGSLLAVYIAIYDPQTGVVVKLPGEIKANPETGQLSTTVTQIPQVPFEDFKINLFEGSRAALTTPATCGTFTTTSVMSPWSGGAPVSPSSGFEVTSGAGGGSCPVTPAQEPMVPSFSAGTFSPIAGTFSPLVVKFGREDGSQQLQSVDVTLPEGLLGKLAGIERCSQAGIEAAEHRKGLGEGRLEIEHASCSSGSEIGVVQVGVGSGAPFYVTGHAYLAGPYGGAPYSVVAIAPATAGPFDLGVVVVRSGLFIDPSSVRVTVKSDPFPQMLYGVPVDIRSVSVQATRPGFTLNPTSCEKMQVTGTITSTQGVVANVSSPFQVGGCNNLPFKPSFTASTNGSTSRQAGASLSVKVLSNPGDANVAKVDVQLPKQLPSRLTTLQKACTEAQFSANPAGCPAASRVAAATVHTPLLGSALTGPVYFVSHGGAKFPDLVMVLQAEGVTITLVGHTEINGGITYSRFEAVPDAPFTSFELEAPQGPNSILGANLPASANRSFCGQSLTMPTILTAQNGLVLRQQTQISVTGCAKARGLTRAQLLARALRTCGHRYRGASHARKRKVCERAAHKRYGAKSKHKK
jgi:hypothetical protein